MFTARLKMSDKNRCDDGKLRAEYAGYKEHLFKTARDNASCGLAFSGMTTLEGKPYLNEKLLSINTSGSPAAVASLNPVTQESTVRTVGSPSFLLDMHHLTALGPLCSLHGVHKDFFWWKLCTKIEC
jgi:hypothetical protein